MTTPTSMTCRTLVELLTDYLEGALPDDERVLLEAHLAGCEG
ncbi:MAG TPA: zf-HC2 domain-containing protein [Actinomycetota bacterium]|nr:zf-HC2 domain-containing protein [Actinomycetota bacterium]